MKKYIHPSATALIPDTDDIISVSGLSPYDYSDEGDGDEMEWRG